MKPAEFYQRQYVKGSGVGKKRKNMTGIGAEFDFYDGYLKMAFLSREYWSNTTIPGAEKIIADYQYQQAKQTFIVSGLMKNFIKSYNKQHNKLFGVNLQNGTTAEDALLLIEKTFRNFARGYDISGNFVGDQTESFNLLRRKNKNGAIGLTPDTVPSYKILLDRLKDINILLNSTEMFISEFDLNELMNKLKNAQNRLEADLKEYNNKNMGSISTEPYLTPGDIKKFMVNIQGSFLESAVENWLKTTLPSGVKVLNAAHLLDAKSKSQITGGSDLITIELPSDDLLDLIEIEYCFNPDGGFEKGIATSNFKKKGTLKDFINDLDMANRKNLGIAIDIDTYNDIFNNAGYNINGISAKAGFGQDIINRKSAHAKISLEENMATGTWAAKSLKILQDWYAESGKVSANNQYYNLYFDYNLAHFLGRLIGEHSSIVATREGIQDTASYLKDQWLQYHKYVRALNKVSMRNTSVAVGISSANLFK